MIIWLASYPKSGNTFLRSLLSTYFFSDNGVFNFELLKNISQFPEEGWFEGLNVDLNNNLDVAKNCIKAQTKLNQGPKAIQFFKTHSSFFNLKGHNFTNLENSLGVIYVIRDPRNVVTSYANHYSISLHEAVDRMININSSIGRDKIKTLVSSWSFNYQSWKQFNNKFLLIRYEDLVNNTKNVFIKIIKFLENLINTSYIINEEKLKKVIETTNFDRLQALEESTGFIESAYDKKTQKKKKFFFLGKKNDWTTILNKEIKLRIEENFKKEMTELGYM